MNAPFDPQVLGAALQALAQKQHRDAALLTALRAAGVAPPVTMGPAVQAAKNAGVSPWPPLIPLAQQPARQAEQQQPAPQAAPLPVPTTLNVGLQYGQPAQAPQIGGFDMGVFGPQPVKPQLARPASNPFTDLIARLQGDVDSAGLDLERAHELLQKERDQRDQLRTKLIEEFTKPGPQRPEPPKGPSTRQLGAAALLSILAYLLGDKRWDFLKGAVSGYQQGVQLKSEEDKAAYEDALRARREQLETLAKTYDLEASDVEEAMRLMGLAEQRRQAGIGQLANLTNAEEARQARMQQAQLQERSDIEARLIRQEQKLAESVQRGDVEAVEAMLPTYMRYHEQLGLPFEESYARQMRQDALRNKELKQADTDWAKGVANLNHPDMMVRNNGLKQMEAAIEVFRKHGDPRAELYGSQLAAYRENVGQQSMQERLTTARIADMAQRGRAALMRSGRVIPKITDKRLLQIYKENQDIMSSIITMASRKGGLEMLFRLDPISAENFQRALSIVERIEQSVGVPSGQPTEVPPTQRSEPIVRAAPGGSQPRPSEVPPTQRAEPILKNQRAQQSRPRQGSSGQTRTNYSVPPPRKYEGRGSSVTLSDGSSAKIKAVE